MKGFKQSFLEDFLISKEGVVYNQKTKRIRKINKNKSGYARLGFWDFAKNKHRHVYIHRMVGLAHVSGYKTGLVINHKNGIRHDNRAENLEWITQRENCSIQKMIGRIRPTTRGMNHVFAKLTDKKVLEIRRLKATGRSLLSISNEFGIAYSTVRGAANGRTWKHIETKVV